MCNTVQHSVSTYVTKKRRTGTTKLESLYLELWKSQMFIATMLLLIQKQPTAPCRRACGILPDPCPIPFPGTVASFKGVACIPGVRSSFWRDQSTPRSQRIVVLSFDLPGGSLQF